MKILSVVLVMIAVLSSMVKAQDYVPRRVKSIDFNDVVFYDQDIPISDLLDYQIDNLPMNLQKMLQRDRCLPKGCPVFKIGVWEKVDVEPDSAFAWCFPDADVPSLKFVSEDQIKRFIKHKVPKPVVEHFLWQDSCQIAGDEIVLSSELPWGSCLYLNTYVDWSEDKNKPSKAVWKNNVFWVGLVNGKKKNLPVLVYPPTMNYLGFVWQLVHFPHSNGYGALRWKARRNIVPTVKFLPDTVNEVVDSIVVVKQTKKHCMLDSSVFSPSCLGYVGYGKTKVDTMFHVGLQLRLPLKKESRFSLSVSYHCFDSNEFYFGSWKKNRFALGFLYSVPSFQTGLEVGLEAEGEKYSKGPVVSSFLDILLWKKNKLCLLGIYNNEHDWTYARWRNEYAFTLGDWRFLPGMQGIFEGQITWSEFGKTIHRQYFGLYGAVEFGKNKITNSPVIRLEAGCNIVSFENGNGNGPFVELIFRR